MGPELAVPRVFRFKIPLQGDGGAAPVECFPPNPPVFSLRTRILQCAPRRLHKPRVHSGGHFVSNFDPGKVEVAFGCDRKQVMQIGWTARRGTEQPAHTQAERTLARVLREAGTNVRFNCLLRDVNVAVLTSGLPKYAELLAGDRCRLVVVALETGNQRENASCVLDLNLEQNRPMSDRAQNVSFPPPFLFPPSTHVGQSPRHRCQFPLSVDFLANSSLPELPLRGSHALSLLLAYLPSSWKPACQPPFSSPQSCTVLLVLLSLVLAFVAARGAIHGPTSQHWQLRHRGAHR